MAKSAGKRALTWVGVGAGVIFGGIVLGMLRRQFPPVDNLLNQATAGYTQPATTPTTTSK